MNQEFPDNGMDRRKALRLIGLCLRAGKLATGMDVSLRAIYAGHAKLLLLASDCSEGSRNKAMRAAMQQNVPHIVVSDRATLGRATGGGKLAVAVVQDSNFAQGILAALGQEGPADI